MTAVDEVKAKPAAMCPDSGDFPVDNLAQILFGRRRGNKSSIAALENRDIVHKMWLFTGRIDPERLVLECAFRVIVG